MRSPFAAFLLVLIGYVAYLQLSGRIEAAMRFDDPAALARFQAIDWEFDGWRSTPAEVPVDLAQLLGADVVVHRLYESRQYALDAWINYYSNFAKGATHAPEVCMELSGWRKTGGEEPPGAIPMSIERYTRKGKGLSVASTFLVGEKFYATQPEAKLGMVREPGPLVFIMVSVPAEGEASGREEREEAIADLLSQIAKRVRCAASQPAASQPAASQPAASQPRDEKPPSD